MSVTEENPIMVMAGGTGGHVFPALAVAEYLRRKGEAIVWLGTRCGIESRVVPDADFAMEWLSIQGLRGKGAMAWLLAPFRLLWACWQAYRILWRLHPKAVLGMGGFVSGPGGLMAWLLRIPLIVHEQNAVTGFTNRLLGRFASQNYFAFPQIVKNPPPGECIGNPVREALLKLETPEVRLMARLHDKMNILVIGGSLGAASLNRMVPAAIARIEPALRPHIKHQCGYRHLPVCRQHYRDTGVTAEVLTFIDDMAPVYAWADLVICRAGALTVAELTTVGLGSILIPYPYAVDDHQYQNARFLEANQAARILRESELDADSLVALIKIYLQDRTALITLANHAHALAKTDATEQLAEGVLARARL